VIEITVPRHRAVPGDITAHCSRTITAEDITEIDGIPVTTVARTLLDLAGVLSVRDLGYALDRAERLQVFDLGAIEDVLDRARGKRGAKALRDAIEGWRAVDTRSELEDLHLELILGAGLPHPQLNVLVDGDAQLATGYQATGNYFTVIGVPAVLGRVFDEGHAQWMVGGRALTLKRHFVEDVRRAELRSKIRELRLPLLVMHSPTDSTVDISNAGEIFREARHPRSFVSLEGADHLLTAPGQAKRAARIISAWADQYLTV